MKYANIIISDFTGICSSANIFGTPYLCIKAKKKKRIVCLRACVRICEISGFEKIVMRKIDLFLSDFFFHDSYTLFFC